MLKGSCHCGAAGWTLEGDPGPATACNCTLCRRYGALWAYDYEGERIAFMVVAQRRRRRTRRRAGVLRHSAMLHIPSAPAISPTPGGPRHGSFGLFPADGTSTPNWKTINGN